MTDSRTLAEVDALLVPAEIWEQVMHHLWEALPNEGVGLIGAEMGEDAGGRVSKVRSFHPGRNTRPSPTRFDLDIRDLVRALREIEEDGQRLGAIVHSHPLGRPEPSRTDLAEAFYPEALMVIVSFAGEIPVAKAWRLEGDESAWRPVEVPIRVVRRDGETSQELQGWA